jgi:hypothetical protein
VKHAWPIAIGVAALAIWAAYPILTIPVFGIAMPLAAGWLLLRSMIEDQQVASKRAQMERATIVTLRRAIEERTIVSLPIWTRDKSVERLVRIVRVDERGVEAVDPNRRISNAYAWRRIDVEKLHQSLGSVGAEPRGEQLSPLANDPSAGAGWLDRVAPGSDFGAVDSLWRRILRAAAAFVKALRREGG